MPRLHDPLWGEIRLNHPVLSELVASAPMQRLRGIDMAGASRYLFPDRRSGTRFEHSLGVLYILQQLGAPLEEQVAGLLHDVPHTAFSHTVDILFPSEEHNYHERFQREVIMRSDIPAILARHSIDLDAAFEPHAFPLLEQPLPDLCADRLDYSLRDLQAAGMVASDECHAFIAQLIPTRRGVLVNDGEAALWFASLFQYANDNFWTGPAEAGAYWALAGALKRALEIGGFTNDDLFSTDDKAMQKLRSLEDNLVQAYLGLLQPGTIFHEAEQPGPYFTTQMKQRSINPQVLEPGWSSPRPLSQLSDEHARLLASRTERITLYRLWSPAISSELQQAVQGQTRRTTDDGRRTTE